MIFEVSRETPQEEEHGFVFLGFIEAVDHTSALQAAKSVYGGHPAVQPCNNKTLAS